MSSVIHEPDLERHWGWNYLTAPRLGKHMYLRQVVIPPCWNSNSCKYASILTYFIIYRLACWAKVNTQQLSHLHLNFSLLLGNFALLSHDIYHHCCVYSVCCVPQINLQFWFFTVDAASLTNGSFHTQHYSCLEEWLEERYGGQRKQRQAYFLICFYSKRFHWISSTYRTIVVWKFCMN